MADAAVDERRVLVERVLVEPVPIDVEQDDTWWPGSLDEWAYWVAGGWHGRCSWSTPAGHTDGAWVPANRIRRRA